MAFKLPRLPINWNTQPQLFERYWDEAMTRLEEFANDILAIPAIQAALAIVNGKADDALADAAAAQIAAAAAASDAAAAQTAASSAQSESSIVNSYPANYISPLLEVDSSGNVAIHNHDRVYGDPTLNPTVGIASDSFGTATSVGQVIRVYYDDALRSGGSVTFQWTVDPTPPPVQGGDRHVVGTLTVPGAGVSPGNPVQPPGYVSP